jgi:hypothetical protein
MIEVSCWERLGQFDRPAANGYAGAATRINETRAVFGDALDRTGHRTSDLSSAKPISDGEASQFIGRESLCTQIEAPESRKEQISDSVDREAWQDRTKRDCV